MYVIVFSPPPKTLPQNTINRSPTFASSDYKYPISQVLNAFYPFLCQLSKNHRFRLLIQLLGLTLWSVLEHTPPPGYYCMYVLYMMINLGACSLSCLLAIDSNYINKMYTSTINTISPTTMSNVLAERYTEVKTY